MSGWLKLLVAAIVAALAAHLVVIGLIPRVIMSVAMERIADRSGGWNRLLHAPRVTAQGQEIVRSSPDLAYSSCALDLTRGPVRLEIHPSGGYASIAIYGANTDTRFVLNDRQMPEAGRAGAQPVRLLVVGPRSPVAARPGEITVSVPSTQALVLVRRLAATPEAFARIEAVRRQDSCAAAQ